MNNNFHTVSSTFYAKPFSNLNNKNNNLMDLKSPKIQTSYSSKYFEFYYIAY